MPQKMAQTSTSEQPLDVILAKSRQLLGNVGRYVDWSPKTPATDLLPLIPLRTGEDGVTKAIDGRQYTRSIPYVLRGRRDEFNFLARRLVQEPSPIALVTGPPSYGKTALLSTVKEYARSIGHTVVELNADDLTDAATIAQKCRNAVMTPQDAPGHAIQREEIAIKAELQGAADTIFTKLGLPLGAARATETIRENIGEIDLLEHLQAVCQYKGQTRPLLIVVDEVQDIAEELAKGPTQISNTKSNLKIFNNRIFDPQIMLPITTILAGLDTAHDIIQPLISRFADGSIVQLTPIATEHIRDILCDYLKIQAPHPISPEYYPSQKLHEWAVNCEGHVLFANQTGRIIQAYALEHGPPLNVEATKEELAELQTILDRRRSKYYREQLPSRKTSPRAMDIIMHLAQATRNNVIPPDTQSEYPITWNAAVDLADKALKTHPKFYHHPHANDLEEIMQRLQKSGIIRYMEAIDHFLHLDFDHTPPPEDHCTIPIPTITSHIRRLHDKMSAVDRERIARNVAEVMHHHPLDPGTRWHRCAYTERAPIPKLPNMEYEPPLARDAPKPQQSNTATDTDSKPEPDA